MSATLLATGDVRPFPWGRLGSVSRAEAALIQRVRRWGEGVARLDDVAHVLGTFAGTKVDVRLRAVWFDRGADAGRDGLAWGLEDADGRHELVIDVEPALAIALVARALQRPAMSWAETTKPLGPLLEGAAAALMAAALRRVHSGIAWRVRSTGPVAEVTAALRERSPLVTAALTVIVDGEAYAAHVRVPEPVTRLARSPSWDAAALRGLGSTPLAIPLVVAVSAASLGDVAALTPGDVWFPGAWPLRRVDGARDAWVGPLALAAPSLEVGVRATLGEGGRLVLAGGVESLAWTVNGMSENGEALAENDTDKVDMLIETIGEVPVVLRVEVGTVEMCAREWAALRKGDVVTLRTRVADPVVLRIGGVAVARGELVEIEGEVGVRIVERLEERGES